MIDQLAEGARADIVGPDEAQPVEPLLLAQSHTLAQRRPPAGYIGSIAQRAAHYNQICWITTRGQAAGFAPILPSLPWSRRAILARCMSHNSALSRRKSAAAFGWPRPHSANGISALATKAASEE